jgi:hypothetical protein
MPTCSHYLVETSAAELHDVLPLQTALKLAQHKGHAQFIGGGQADLFERLDCILGQERVDLIFADIERGAAPPSPAAAIVAAARRLSRRGAVLFAAQSPGQVKDIQTALARAFPGTSTLSLGENLGLWARDEDGPAVA